MTAVEWSAIIGAGSGIAGGLIVTAFAWGKLSGKLEIKMEKFSSDITEVGSRLKDLTTEFSKCQKHGFECSSITRTQLEANMKRLTVLENQQVSISDLMVKHHESDERHTTGEWRKNMLDRLESINKDMDEKLKSQTKLLCDRISTIEKLIVKNGNK